MADTVFVVARADVREFARDMKKAGENAGNLAGTELLKSLRTTFNQRVGAAKEALTRGLIDKNEFRRISQAAAKELNAGTDKGDQTKEARKRELLKAYQEKAARDRDNDRGRGR